MVAKSQSVSPILLSVLGVVLLAGVFFVGTSLGSKISITGKDVSVQSTTCGDLDGSDPLKRGEVSFSYGTHYGQSYDDRCADSLSIREVTCDGNIPKEVILQCPSQTGCSPSEARSHGPELGWMPNTYGANCMTTGFPIACDDPDGNDPTTFGTITVTYTDSSIPTGTTHDSCNDAFSVREWTCSGTIPQDTVTSCPEGFLCVNGACTVPKPTTSSCTDSDGDDPYNKGTTQIIDQGVVIDTQQDSCASYFYGLEERYCEWSAQDSKYVIKKKSIDNYCKPGYECQDGKCIPFASPTCTDSDGGQNLEVKGTASGIDGGVPVSKTDSCYSTTIVNEAYCYNENIYQTSKTCPTGKACLDGACVASVTPICKDSDNGKDPNVLGTVSGNDEAGNRFTNTDSCQTFGSLTEYYCDGTTKKSTPIVCPTGKKCVGGICVSSTPQSCTDTDGGQNPEVKGVVSGVNQYSRPYTFTDKCIGTKVYEYYCIGVNPWPITKACPNGKPCSDGACK